MPIALEMRDVWFAFAGAPPVLRSIDLTVERGEFLAIAGPNGGGKTTLLRLALGLLKPTRGAVRLFGEPVQQMQARNRLGYLAQHASASVDAPVTVREVVSSGTVAAGRLLGPAPRGTRRLVDEMIARVGLTEHACDPVRELSGGQRQRAFLARVLAGRPQLLALDEPTTGVDVDAQLQLARLLRQLHDDLSLTLLYVSHEFGAVEDVVDRLVLVSRSVTFAGDPQQLPGIWHDPSHRHA